MSQWEMLLRLFGLQAKQDVEWQQSALGRRKTFKTGTTHSGVLMWQMEKWLLGKVA